MSHDEEKPKPPRVDVIGLARYTVPAHALIPVALWLTWGGREDTVTALVVGVHIGFPVLLMATFQHWRTQVIELIGLVAVNHVITFLSSVVLLAMLSE